MMMSIAMALILMTAMVLKRFQVLAVLDMMERVSMVVTPENNELPEQTEACIRSGLVYRVGRIVHPLPVRAYSKRIALAL